jgi:hypothetical protein
MIIIIMTIMTMTMTMQHCRSRRTIFMSVIIIVLSDLMTDVVVIPVIS